MRQREREREIERERARERERVATGKHELAALAVNGTGAADRLRSSLTVSSERLGARIAARKLHLADRITL